MIRSFADKATVRLFEQERVPRFQSIERIALRRLLVLDNARSLNDLKGPGFQLELLTGSRKGQHSIRINDRWRVCFVWRDGEAHDVEVTDYH